MHLGRLTDDVRIHKTQVGDSVATFSIAVNNYQDKEATFLRCVDWKKTAEYLEQYSQKGSRIAIIGRIETGSYLKDGIKINTTEIVVNHCEIIDFKDRTVKRDLEDIDDESEPSQKIVAKSDDDFETGELTDINTDNLPF